MSVIYQRMLGAKGLLSPTDATITMLSGNAVEVAMLFSNRRILDIAAVKDIINKLDCKLRMGAVDYYAHDSVLLLEGVNLGKVGSII